MAPPTVHSTQEGVVEQAMAPPTVHSTQEGVVEQPMAPHDVMSDEEMGKVFAAFDADGNGTLEVAELLHFVKVCVCVVYDAHHCIYSM